MFNTPNWFAYTALLLWPIIVFRLFRKSSAIEGTFWAIFGGLMWLPVNVGIDLPLIPEFNKESVPAISACLACMRIAKVRILFFGKKGLAQFLLITTLFSPFITVLLNGDIYQVAGRVLPGVTLYDAISTLMTQFILFLPFILARQIFKTKEDHILLFKMLIKAGLIYSLFILLEIRLSPQLHRWVYGFFPHSFEQQMRDDGFRSVVFMSHGLRVGIFLMTAVLSAALFWKLKQRINRFSPLLVMLYLFIVQYLQKSTTALLLATASILAINFTPPKITAFMVKIILFIGLFYPILCLLQIFPHQYLINFADIFGPDRAASLAFRFNNEEVLLKHAADRLLFGWGAWGRNRVYAEDMGNEYGVTDGIWIITLGTYGLVGFISQFGLLTLPAFKAINLIKTLKSDIEIRLLLAHCLLLACILVDQLPNSSLGGWAWLLCGALLGRCEYIANNPQEKTVKQSTAMTIAPYNSTEKL
ncbi:hypothetical protein [Methylomonas sp. AM2-LC]|uniref:hypothetical protein n=1 Tax=Methylomonas sp. AM2-LC TaxID=3153301 RepID=UPI003264E59B